MNRVCCLLFLIGPLCAQYSSNFPNKFAKNKQLEPVTDIKYYQPEQIHISLGGKV